MSSYQQMLQAAASAYGADPGVLDSIANLESGRKLTGSINNWDSNAKAGHPSEGIVQYIPSTFESHRNAAIKANRAAWQGVSRDFRDPQAQLMAAAWGITHNKGPAWATWGRAQKAKGSLPGAGRDSAAALPVTGNAPASDPIAEAIIARHSGISPLVLGMLGESGAQPAPPTRLGGAAAPTTPLGKPTAGGWQALQRIAQQKFGLRNDAGSSQTTGGHHTQGSEHYSGRAIDFGNAKNSQAQLNAWKKWAQSHGYDTLNEGDHIHVSLPGGGV